MPTFLVVATSLALLGLAGTPRSACACSTKVPSYIVAIRAELRTLEGEQLDFRADSGRFATRAELEARGWTLWSAVNVNFDSLTDSTFQATSSAPGYLGDGSCTLTLADESTPWEERVTCKDLPVKRPGDRRIILIYAAVVLLALVLRLALAGRTHPPMTFGAAIPLVLLVFVHPFWFHLGDLGWCDAFTDVGPIWIFAAGAYVVKLVFTLDYVPPPPPRPPATSRR